MKDFQDAQFVIISIIGPHAGENEEEIFERKMMDIRNIGETFWVTKSSRVSPKIVQHFFYMTRETKQEDIYVVFLEGSTRGAARPTKVAESATLYSADLVEWIEIPNSMTPVTGKLDRRANAFIFDSMEMADENAVVDLWNYVDFLDPEQPLKIRLGASTVCVIRKNTSGQTGKIRSRFRRVVAFARLKHPYYVWIK